MKLLLLGSCVLVCAASPNIARAQQSGEPSRDIIEVIGTAPLPGSEIDPDKIPGNTQLLSSADVRREGQASVIRAINGSLGSVSINDDLNDTFQPDVVYRGFTASPVLGTSEGLAVYQNGVRINEAFGDTVNWDLFPDIAVNRVSVMGSNPVFGLNALGGALVIEMKSGFTYQGGEAEISGGSFGQRNLSLQYGRQFGNIAVYLAGRILNADGWRRLSPDSVAQLYGDLATRNDKYAFDLSFTGANNLLEGQGPAPVQELAVDRSAIFTNPQNNRNQLEFVTLNGSYDPSDTLSVHGNFYYREFRQTVANGNRTNDAACDDGSGLCDADGLPLIGRGGAQIPDISEGGLLPIGENDGNATRTVGLGGSLQTTYTAPLLGRDNHLVVGVSVDRAATDYQAQTQLGIVSPELRVAASGLFVDEPDTAAGPVVLGTTNHVYGLYVTDTLDVTPDFTVTASGRFNSAGIRLEDRLGTALNGDSTYRRFNPAVGVTYKIRSGITAYAGYSESNRAPTAGELACSNPEKPCILPGFLASDPPNLKQVVAHSYELGLRGSFTMSDLPGGRVAWKAGLYRTDLDDDIISVTSPISLNEGFFENAGQTRRQGAEASLSYRDARWSAYANYSLVDATYRSPLQLQSASPAADANGNIEVKPGDHVPGVPRHRLKFGVDYQATAAWTIGGTLNFISGQYFANDQSNQNQQLPGHIVVNLHSTYRMDDDLEFFGELDNAFDARYATFGTFGNPTGVGALGIPSRGGAVDPRFLSPAPPIGAFGGIRAKF